MVPIWIRPGPGASAASGPSRSGQKSLNENLAPLRRYLERNVGRPWSKVYAEICATLDSRKATGLHILQHLRDFVACDTWLDGRTVMVWGERLATPDRTRHWSLRSSCFRTAAPGASS